MRDRSIVIDSIILLFAVMLFYNCFLNANSITPGSDMTNLFYPLKFISQKALRSGVLPLWNPFTFCGSPLLASQQSSPFYPPDLLISRPRALTLGLNLYKLFHLWLMANFFYVFLQSLKSFRIEPPINSLRRESSGIILASKGKNHSSNDSRRLLSICSGEP